MASVSGAKGSFTIRAYVGDAKTLLAMNIGQPGAKNLAGFTIQCQPSDGQPYYLLNNLQFETPADHAQDSSEPANSSINAPFRKFRWLHVPGAAHQGIAPPFGSYTYFATPRHFNDKGEMQPLDKSLTASVTVEVLPFTAGKVSLGFTRGFTQSQAFVHHFGKDALIKPKGATLVFDTKQKSGANAQGEQYTFQQEYGWLGFTARQKVFDVLTEVLNDDSLHLDMFAYDLNEPDVLAALLKLAAQGRVRLVLDDAALHHATPPKKAPAKSKTAKAKPKAPPPEDQFTALFQKAAKGKAAIQRGHFARYAHDKIFIVSKDGTPATARKVLTGSTNFSVTGLYVNSNHVLIFDDPTVAGTYAQVFNAVWDGKVQESAFVKSPYAAKSYAFAGAGVPKMEITFSPHTSAYAGTILGGIADRVTQEGKKSSKTGSVLFAVMQLDGSNSPVYEALAAVHKDQDVFSFGISDTTSGIALYAPGNKTGVLVTGKPSSTVLPPPFDQVPGVGLGHQVHHKFVVCGFNGDDAVVYCGSSNLAPGGEASNGDNLLAIHDQDIATVFAIEAIGLVDHFNFLDKYATKAAIATKTSKKKAPAKKKPASNTQAALSAQWFLDTNDKWTASYFNSGDLHCVDRLLFA